jgi:hypothetical protein
VATQTEGDGRHHVLLAGRTLQLCQDAFTDVTHSSLHAECNEIVVQTLKERRQPPETQHFDQYHPTALLPHSDTKLFLPNIRTTDFHLGSLPPTACFYTLTRPPPGTPPCEWLGLFSSQNRFPYIYPNNLILRLFRRPRYLVEARGPV